MSRYTKEFKLKVVQDYESFNIGYTMLSKKYEVQTSLLKKWIYGYQCHGAEYFEKRTQIYSTEFKLSVLLHMKEHQLPPIRVAAFFGIPAFTSVIQWQKLYDTGGAAALVAKPRGRLMMKKSRAKIDKPPKEMTQDELLEEVLNLRAERDYLKKLQALIQEKQLATKPKPH